MNTITFHTTLGIEPFIRLPAGMVLPSGEVEITIRSKPTPPTAATVAAANERLRQCRVNLGYATGADNASIDTDLENSYGEGME
ncbi:MAG: hypothetical protein ACRCZF_23555 [Gemmataceae bacterium]